MITATCGHEIDGDWFIDLKGHAAVKGLSDGERVVKYVVLCRDCLRRCRREGIVLEDDAAKENWLNGADPNAKVW